MKNKKERFKESVIVSPVPFTPNVELIKKILSEMGLKVK